MQSIDELLAKELNDLSFENRAEIQEEIHCVKCCTVEESPQLIKFSIGRLQEEIAALPLADRKAYLDSVATDSQYYLQPEVQLKFLRAEKFNVKRAAIRLTKNAAILLKYFGPVALQRPLRYSDLGKAEQELLRLGHDQILPSRDKAVCEKIDNISISAVFGTMTDHQFVCLLFFQGRLIHFVRSGCGSVEAKVSLLYSMACCFRLKFIFNLTVTNFTLNSCEFFYTLVRLSQRTMKHKGRDLCSSLLAKKKQRPPTCPEKTLRMNIPKCSEHTL